MSITDLHEYLRVANLAALNDIEEAKEQYIRSFLDYFGPEITVDDVVLEEHPFKFYVEEEPLAFYTEYMVPRLRIAQEFRVRLKTLEEKQQEAEFLRQQEIDRIIYEI